MCLPVVYKHIAHIVQTETSGVTKLMVRSIKRYRLENMKVLFLSIVLSCSTHALVLHANQGWKSGVSDQYKSESNLGGYAFGYNEDHTDGGSFRREIGDIFGNKYGSYGLRDGDGRIRVVNYVADNMGYRADVSTNEPGVETHSPAFSTYNKMSIGGVHVPAFAFSGGPTSVTFESSDLPTSSLQENIPMDDHEDIRVGENQPL